MRYVLLALSFLVLSGQSQCDTPVPVEESHTFTIAVVDSMESRWGYWWSQTYETQLVFDEINARGVDFVVSTGDNLACNPEHPATMVNCALELKGAMAHYLDIPVYYVAGNHDVSSYPDQRYVDIWEELVAPMRQEFTHKGAHFVLLSDGQHQFDDIPQEDIDWYCGAITSDTLSFRHMVKIGGDIGTRRIDCELDGGVQAVLHGHYGQWEDYEYGSTRYMQTADAMHGNVRFLTIAEGRIVSTEEWSQ